MGLVWIKHLTATARLLSAAAVTGGRQINSDNTAQSQGIDLPLEPNFDQWLMTLESRLVDQTFQTTWSTQMVNDTPDNENIILLEGRNVVVSPQEDHEKHIDVHNEALQIAKTRETQDRIIEHIAEHDKFIIQQQQLEAQNAARQAVDNISGRASDILKGAIERRTAEAQMAGGGEVGQEVPRAQGFGGIPTIGADIAPEGAVGLTNLSFKAKTSTSLSDKAKELHLFNAGYYAGVNDCLKLVDEKIKSQKMQNENLPPLPATNSPEGAELYGKTFSIRKSEMKIIAGGKCLHEWIDGGKDNGEETIVCRKCHVGRFVKK